jgi:hypothetical protein
LATALVYLSPSHPAPVAVEVHPSRLSAQGHLHLNPRLF